MDSSTMSRWERALLLVFMLLVIGMRIYHAPNYPYHEDEIGSIGVMRSIVETGLPLAENGTLYWRSLLGHYLMAIPLFFAEVSPVSTRLVCILFSALLLPVVYAMGCRAAGKSAGRLAVLFLGFSAFENLYASMARFYLPFQFFFVAAVYWAGEYFIEKRPGAGRWLLLATLGAIGTHEFAFELLPVFALALLLGGRRSFRQRSFRLGCVAVAAVGYFCLVFRPATAFVNYSAIPLQLFGLENRAAFYEWFRQTTPLGATLVILGLYPLWRERNRCWTLYFLGFAGLLLFLTVFSPGDNPRYLSNIYPLGVVAAAASLSWWIRRLSGGLRRRAEWASIPAPVPMGLVVVLALIHLFVLENLDLNKAFGGYFKFVDQRPAHEFIKQRLLPGDVIISTEPALSAFYLGRPVDYSLREKMSLDTGGYSEFPVKEKAGYPFQYIDSPVKLDALLKSEHRRVWLYANWKIVTTISPEMDAMIVGKLRPLYSENETYVLQWP
ncbi:MAG: glycosyltransferase family 39 protein [Trichloromonas sp.]|nr:glycosyltransferase family 39 protein [Trichloromonas sp.]